MNKTVKLFRTGQKRRERKNFLPPIAPRNTDNKKKRKDKNEKRTVEVCIAMII